MEEFEVYSEDEFPILLANYQTAAIDMHGAALQVEPLWYTPDQFDLLGTKLIAVAAEMRATLAAAV